ncbi:hypothetical protein [uncultured Mobiluncus sp.]|nr:hypothetical protein [uncultured Mobiluncus sp.]
MQLALALWVHTTLIDAAGARAPPMIPCAVSWPRLWVPTTCIRSAPSA